MVSSIFLIVYIHYARRNRASTWQDLGYAEADPTADVEGHDVQVRWMQSAVMVFFQRTHSDDHEFVEWYVLTCTK